MPTRPHEFAQQESNKMHTPEEQKQIFYHSQILLLLYGLKKNGKSVDMTKAQNIGGSYTESEEWIDTHRVNYRRFFDENAEIVCSLIEGCKKLEDCAEDAEELAKKFAEYEQTHH